MRAVFIVFVAAFLGLTGLSVYQHLTRGPQQKCGGSSVQGFLDYASDAEGLGSPRAAALQYARGGDRLLVERPTEPEMPAYVFRSYDGDELLAIIDVSRAPVSGWIVTGTQTC